MNSKTTTNPGAEKEKRLDLLAKANLKTGYRVGWQEGDRKGTQDDVYTSFLSAVEMADLAQQQANDRGLAYKFSVLDTTGKIIYTA